MQYSTYDQAEKSRDICSICFKPVQVVVFICTVHAGLHRAVETTVFELENCVKQDCDYHCICFNEPIHMR